jgi:hypothetical protein
MLQYPDLPLKKLAEASYDDDEALQWLLKNGYPELAALKEAVICDEPDALAWLVRFNKNKLVTFVAAVKGNFDAVKQLLSAKEPLLAATANAVQGDENAYQWLIDKGFRGWAELSQAIAYNLSSRSGSSVSYGSSYSSGSWSGGSGDWGGYGGGSFGGGGSSGKW